MLGCVLDQLLGLASFEAHVDQCVQDTPPDIEGFGVEWRSIGAAICVMEGEAMGCGAIDLQVPSVHRSMVGSAQDDELLGIVGAAF